MQLTLNINNNNTMEKILWMLSHFKNDGVEIVSNDSQKVDTLKYSDEYIHANWKDIIMKLSTDNDYIKSEKYKEDRGQYLLEKYQ